MNRKLLLILPLLVLGFLLSVNAQCPTNIDWETGTYSNWNFYTGTISGTGVITTGTSGYVAGRFTLTSGSGVDPFGFFPVVSPGGGTYSLQLGNSSTGAQAERVRYYVHVPTGGVYSLLYRYAVVLENPAGHGASVQPHMEVKAFDSITGTVVPCTNYTYVSSPSIPGFLTSSVIGTGGSTVYYKTWTLGNMKFPGYGGATVAVDFLTTDCGLSGHFGYGYIDMSCGFFANSIIGCASGSTVLAGPDGYSGYNWVDSLTYGTSYGSSQIVTITAPTVTTTYALILTPYTGYGCPDTLYTRVIPSTLVLSASNDTTICSGASIPLVATGSSTAMPITYAWAPATGLSATTGAAVTATPTVTTTYTVTATDANGCVKREPIAVTVVPMPTGISGPSTVCPSATITLAGTPSGGTWTGGPTTVATIGAFSGVVTGVSPGVFTVVYTMGGICSTSRTVTVTAAPAPITGPSAVCVGSTITEADATTGGTWSAPGYSSIATIGSTSGIVTGVGAGLASITYTAPGGCFVTRVITVNPTPSAITGISNVCVYQTTSLFSSPSGGIWSISPTTIATIGSSTGVVTGVSTGTAYVTYTLPTGCAITSSVNVTPVPSPISGPSGVCVGSTITVTDTATGCFWSVTNPALAYVDAFGVVTGLSPGVDTVLYTNSTTGCYAMHTVTVYAIPAPITGSTSVCVGATTLLSDVDPGVWSSSFTSIATIGSSSGLVLGVAPGVDTIILTSPMGCRRTTLLNVYPLPAPIGGPSSLCVGTTITLTDATTPGSFSTSPIVAANVTTGGLVTGLSAGVQIITYTETAHGCSTTKAVSVNSTPPPITGTLSVCQGSSTTLFNSTGGGTWSITPTTVATIGSSSGVVTGVVTGSTTPATATVTYSVGAGCSTTAIVTVNPLPGPIVPASPAVCVGSTITLTNPTTPGGTWSTTSTNASVGASSGIVTGLSFGVAVITYTLPSTCTRTITVTVNALPLAIVGPGSVCQAATVTLTDPTLGGVWTSLSPGIANIGSTTGIVTGVSPGVTTIRYTMPTTGCFVTTTMTVNPLPGLFSVTGGGNFCAGGAGVPVGLSGSAIGVNYQLMLGASPVGSPVAGTGGIISFGLQTAPGTYTVVATTAATGCNRTMSGSATIVVYPLPLPIVGPTAVCAGATMTLTDGMPGGTWISSNPLAATIHPTSGLVTGVGSGLSTIITYTLPTGCSVTTTVNVTLSPGPISGPSAVCVFECVTFTDPVPGGTWSSSSPTVASVGTFSGSVCGVSFGTATISYSLGSGCTVTKGVSVTAAPAPITGPSSVCVGQSITQADATPGGAWSVDPASASLGSITSTGVFTGLAAGVATISYTASGGTGCGVSKFITVNALPGAIGGSTQVCQGACGTLTSSTSGGVWTISPTPAATIVATTGVLCGIVTGTLTTTATVTYTALGCPATAVVTINPLPANITGTARVCQGSTTALSSTPGGGTWTSGSPNATVDPVTGVVTGVVTGGTTPTVATITYTLPTGCSKNINVTVNPIPQPNIGPTAICVGQVAVFANPTPGGTWSSSVPSIAPIGATTGSVTGAMPGGTSVISYTLPVTGCAATTNLNVIPPPAPIAGSFNVCVGGCNLLTDPTPGGSWSSSLPGVATVSSTGLVCGVSSGTTIISYGVGTGCSVIQPVVVNPVAPIMGTPVVCVGQTTTLTDTALGGIWTSSLPTVASVGPSTGVVTGIAGGISTITYTLPTGCAMTIDVTVNPVPAPISGPSQACLGDVVVMSTTTPSGTWSSSSPGVASIDLAGVVSALSPGTTVITYTLPGTGCDATKSFTVNDLPAPINGPNDMCLGSTVTYTNPSGPGSWTSSVLAVATIGSLSGDAYGAGLGATDLTFYLFSTGCATTKMINVVNLPTVSPDIHVCQGGFATVIGAPGGGTWTSATPAVATVDPFSGLVYGATPGTTTLSYSLGVGCTTPLNVTVDPIPAGISGMPTNLCIGATYTLTSSPGGTWSSSDPLIATVGALSGIVTGVSAGTAIITYTMPTGCMITALANVYPGPAPITGINTVCIGSTTTLFSATPGGTWASSNVAVGTVDPAFGVVYGITPGNTDITYTVPGFMCPSTMNVTVNPLPLPISGALNVCQGETTPYTDAISGGTWSTSDPLTATIVSSTGLLTGVVTGISAPVGVTVTYTLGAGCVETLNIMVNPVPAPISGPNSVCQGQTMTVFNTTPGGAWSSSNPAVGSVNMVGDVTGITPGGITVSYTNAYGCAANHPVTVYTSPAPISGSLNVCLGGTSALSNSVPGGTWFSLNNTIATVSSTGVVTGVTLGTVSIVYSMPGGCYTSVNITVHPLPTVFAVTGGGNHCSGDAGVPIGLTGSTVGVNYMVYRGSTAVGAIPGTGSALSLGMYTVPGTYTVTGTSTATTCVVNMAGFAIVNITPSVTPAVTLNVSPNDTVCAGTSVSYTPVPVNGGVAPTYQWSVNGVPVALTTTYTFIPADGDNVSVAMTSDALCPMPATVTSSQRMTVQPFGTPNIDMALTPNDTVCQGTVMTVNPVTTFGGAAPIYTWVKNGFVIATGPSYTFVPDNGDVIFGVVSSNYPCRLANVDTSMAVTIVTETPLMPVVNIVSNPGWLISKTAFDTLTATAINVVNPTYQWYMNGYPVAGATNATFITNNFSFPYPDSVSCIVSSNGVCPASGFDWIYIEVTPVGVNNVASGSDISVVPNPNKGEFLIRGTLGTVNDEEVAVEVTNMIGQVVYTKNAIAKSGTMNERVVLGKDLANGMYILTLRSGGQSKVFHIVVEQ